MGDLMTTILVLGMKTEGDGFYRRVECRKEACSCQLIHEGLYILNGDFTC